VQAWPLPTPGGTAQLLDVVEELWSRPLDLTAPLWRMWFLPGLAGGRVAVLLKVHHAVADGVAGMALLGALLDEDPGADRPSGRRPTTTLPLLRPTTRALARDELGRLREVARTVSALARPAALLAALRRARTTLHEFDRVRRTPATSLDRVVGPGRRLAVVRSRLDVVRDVAHTHGATVNDVLLTAVAGGLRELLLSRGEDVRDRHPLAYEPVTLLLRRRPGGHPDDAGMIFVPLPVGVADPVERLRAVAAATAERKRHVIPAPVGLPTRTRLVRRIMMRVAARQRWAAVYVADVPGPRTRLHLEGAELQELFPVVPLAGRTPIGVGALSYAGALGITVVTDRDACPDIATFTDGLRTTLAELAPAVAGRAVNSPRTAG
jgi:WS/DGAT/MGAT family acyltransferase